MKDWLKVGGYFFSFCCVVLAWTLFAKFIVFLIEL